jgi:lysozyme
MRPRLSASKAAVELIKGFEGFRPGAARLDDGRWTIGYGHTRSARSGARVTAADAEALLLYDLIQVAHAINEHVFAPLNQNQFDALASFVFNIGVPAFRTSPTLRRLNEGRTLDAALAMELWRKSDVEGERIVVDALVRRRAAEKALFLTPPEGWLPAPTPVLPPRIDYDILGLIPMQSPAMAHAPLSGERAFAERAAAPHPDQSEPPSAAAAAAEAVIDRLQSILAEPDRPSAERPSRAPEHPNVEPGSAPPSPPRPAAEVPRTAPRADGLRTVPPMTFVEVRSRGAWIGPVVIAILAIVGVALLALAGVWGFRTGEQQVLGLGARMAALAAGAVGVVAFGVATYMLLDRLGLPHDSR